MKEKMNAHDQKPERHVRILLCDATGNVGGLSSPEAEWVSSPVQCLNRAVDLKPEFIMIRFGRLPIRESEALVELSAALKRNSHTRKCSVLVLLHSKHRKLMEDLNGARVDFVKYIGKIRLDSNQLRPMIDGLGSDDCLERHLANLCCFLHYREIDSRHEMTVCGAYRDRMVLGGRWLHKICETENHRHCEYYLDPRVKS